MTTNLPDILKRLHTAHPAQGFVSVAPAGRWDDGTCVGNGTQGVLAFCRTRREELVLSHEELFLPLYPFAGYLPVREHLDEVRRLVMEGKAHEAQELLRRIKVDWGAPGYNTTNPFVGAGRLVMEMGDDREPAAYIRSVDFEMGEALTAWHDDGGLFHRRFFVSRAADLIVVRLTSPAGDKLSASLSLGEIPREPVTLPNDRDLYPITIDGCEGTVSASGDESRGMGVPTMRPIPMDIGISPVETTGVQGRDAPATRGQDARATNPEALLTHRMRFKRRLADQRIFGCCIVARVVARGGSTSVDGDRLRITDADDLLLLARIVPDRGGDTLSVEDEAARLSAVAPDYDALLADHADLHREMFCRCSLRLGSSDAPLRSSEDLIAGSSVGATDPALVERTFAAGRFGIISSTGKLPPALQGVWTGTWKPRWSGDYTLNGNVQSMVAGSLPANHFECMASTLNYMDSLLDDFRDNARELLGFRGPLIPWRSSTHGRTHYLSYRKLYHNFPGIYWFAGAGWFAQLYYDYYLYTGDEVFWQRSLRPFLLDAVSFYEDYLKVERDGAYVLSPSSSPENVVDRDMWMAPNATMTIAAIKQLLRTALALADRLGVDGARVERWRTMLAKMPPYEVGESGALKEWAWPGIENNEAHRHASHLYPLYYGVDPEIAADERLGEACRIAIDKRMAFRRPEQGGDMAFGFTQMGMSAAHLGETALAYECVEYLVNSYWSPAMVSQHNVRDVLNLDISGGLPAVIVTMLVQSLLPAEPGGPWIIRLLPCLPDAWPEGELRGVRCRGGFEVDIRWTGGALEGVTVTSHLDASCRLVCGDRSAELALARGERCCLCAQLKRD